MFVHTCNLIIKSELDADKHGVQITVLPREVVIDCPMCGMQWQVPRMAEGKFLMPGSIKDVGR